MRTRALLTAVVSALLVCAVTPVHAAASAPPASPPPAAPPSPTADPYQAQLQAQIAQQQALDATKQSLQAEVQAAHDQQQALATLITTNQQAIQDTLTQLAAQEQKYQDATVKEANEHAAAELALHQERADKLALALYVRDRYMEQDGLLTYVLSSSTISEMMSRASDVSHLVDRGEELVGKVKQDVADAQAAEAAAKKDADAAQAAASALQTQEQQLQTQIDNANQLMQQLGYQERAAAAEIQAADNQSLEVAQSIAATRIAQLDATIAAAEQAAWQAAEYWIQQHLSVVPSGFDAGPAPGQTIQFIWPAARSQVVQWFGPSVYPFEPPFQGYPHFHTGVDVSNGMGTPIVAAADGVVVAADSSDVGYGNHVIIAHAGGYLTLYGHLETMLVKAGDSVKQGQMIALMGSTGNSTGPHCHFEVRLNNTPIDPAPLLPQLPQGSTETP